MSKTFPTVCPVCHETIMIPFQDAMRAMGRNAWQGKRARVAHSPKRRRWGPGVITPKQKELLALDRAIGLEHMTYEEIANRLGMTGNHLSSRVYQKIKHLEQHGLLKSKWNGPLSENQRKILDLAKQTDISKLTYKQISAKIGGDCLPQAISRNMKQLKKKGLL